MERMEFAEKIQKLVCDKLRRSYHSVDRNKSDQFLQGQYDAMIQGLEKIYTAGGKNQKLDQNLITIPSELSLPEKEHIGISANMCLKRLEENTDNIEDSQFYNFVQYIFRHIEAEARESLNVKKTDKARLEDIKDHFRMYADEWLEEAKETFAQIQKNLDEVQQENNKVKKIAKDAEKKFNEAVTVADDAKTAAEDAKTEATTATVAAKSVKRTADGILPMMLTVLGVFVAIIVAVVACYLNIILMEQNVAKSGILPPSRPFDIFQFVLMGHIMLAVIFLLLYLVSKMTVFNLSCHCSAYDSLQQDGEKKFEVSDCSTCKVNCCLLIRFRRRYPYVYIINLVFLVVYVIIAIWQTVNIYCRDQLDKWIMAHIEIIPIGIGVVFVALLVGIGTMLFIQPKKK